MTHRFITLSTAALLALAGLTASASAQEAGAVHGAKTVGAMRFETLGRATSAADVLRQGGFATAGAVDWTKAAAEQAQAASPTIGAAYGGSVGALQRETAGLATGPAEVRRQGGAMTASAVRWVSAPAQE